MKKMAIILGLIISLVVNAAAQQIFKDEVYGFSINQPQNWLVADHQFATENFKKNIELDAAKKIELIKKSNGSAMLVAFYKYNVETHVGIIPTIKINVRENPTKTIEQFKIYLGSAGESIKKVFPDFIYLTKPAIITINGRKAVYFTGSYTIKSTQGVTAKVRTRTYGIPNGSYFFFINFTDELGVDEESKLYQTLVQSIKIGK